MSELIDPVRNYVDAMLRKCQCIVCTQCTVRSVFLFAHIHTHRKQAARTRARSLAPPRLAGSAALSFKPLLAPVELLPLPLPLLSGPVRFGGCHAAVFAPELLPPPGLTPLWQTRCISLSRPGQPYHTSHGDTLRRPCIGALQSLARLAYDRVRTRSGCPLHRHGVWRRVRVLCVRHYFF